MQVVNCAICFEEMYLSDQLYERHFENLSIDGYSAKEQVKPFICADCEEEGAYVREKMD